MRLCPGAGCAPPGDGVSADMSMTLPSPEPRDITWNPPESVNVGPGQFMKVPSPPAASRMSSPGSRNRWYALASIAWAPSAAMDSGSTAFTAACVATGMNAGVRIGPCGVVMVPVRAWNWPPLSRMRCCGTGESRRRVWSRKVNGEGDSVLDTTPLCRLRESERQCGAPSTRCRKNERNPVSQVTEFFRVPPSVPSPPSTRAMSPSARGSRTRPRRGFSSQHA